MKRTMWLGTTVVAAAVWSAPVMAACTCEIMKIHDGWCDEHKIGFVDGVTIESKTLFDSLNGKYTSTYGMECENCKQVFKIDGWCEEHKVGYVVYKAFKSKVAHALAKGRPVEASEITCETCKKNSADKGWCETCKAGMVGCRKYTDQPEYEAASAARVILLEALKTECEDCRVAMVSDGTCEKCKITYQAGKKTAGGSK